MEGFCNERRMAQSNETAQPIRNIGELGEE